MLFKATVQRQGGAGRMQAIKNKIRSRRGASLTFALLLFLVCAVIGSIVLAAGFAASGRLAGLAESEKRYYAVNSAAELIVDQLCGSGNKVTVGIEKDAGSYRYELPESSAMSSKIAQDLAKYLVFGKVKDLSSASDTDKATLFANLAKPESENDFWSKKDFTFELTVETKKDAGGKHEIPVVLVDAKFINGYQLNLTIRNKTDDPNDKLKQYELPTIILETDPPRGINEADRIEFTFNWRVPEG